MSAGSEGVIVYLLACGLEKGSLIFQLFLQPFSIAIRELHNNGTVTHSPAVNIMLINGISYLEDNNIS